MTDQSPYLVQALRQLQAPAAAPQQGASISPQQMATFAKQARAWQDANPGQSYLGHQLGQAGQNIMGVPSQIASGIGGLAQIFNPAAAQPPQAPMGPQQPPIPPGATAPY